ncbi:putative cytochrome P450 120 [Ostrea edulis]|uniref:putative cytochrome P450 120 n=1 Tax=Ostrea edulis TaxID=37623 RepID=UPI002094CE3D|nr:putative cytochrome P450 120 [Ostrea edulis]
MSKVPGSCGFPILGDKSIDFYRDPVQFVSKNIQQNKSRVFCARFLNIPTVFIGCNETIRKLLTDGSESTDLGYKQFMGEIFGDNILFSDGDLARETRTSLSQLFCPASLDSYQATISRIVEDRVHQLGCLCEVSLYTFMKSLCTEICLSLFLGMDFKDAEETAEKIIDLTTTHWHGIISVPVSIKLPLAGGSSFCRALEAKDDLLGIIKQNKSNGTSHFPKRIQQCPLGTRGDFVDNHLLLFTSALVPKALSSILTSLLIQIGSHQTDRQTSLLEDEKELEAVLLEVQRMFPPFLGGRRVANQNFNLNGYHIPKGHALVYMSYHGHRDPRIFQFPDQFNPDRWKESNVEDKDRIFCFGAGPRGCVGQRLVWNILKTIVRELLRRYSIKVKDDQDLSHKWLPVTRPKSEVKVKFIEKTRS